MSATDHLYYHPSVHTGPEYTEIPTGTPDRFTRVVVSSDHMVVMRDGIRLATDVYHPDAPGPYPTMLIRLPYGKTEPVCVMPLIAGFWARKGYACVVQDVRGKWGSEGVFVPAVGETEVKDGYDTIEWITKQPFSNGRVGMYGESYYGFTSYAGAVGGHPALKCIAPGDIGVDRYRNVYKGGVFQFNTMGHWALAMNVDTVQDVSRIDPWHLPLKDLPQTGGIESPYFQELIRNPTRGAFWEARSLLDAHTRVSVPMLSWTGWYDTFLGGQLADWAIIAEGNREKKHCHLLIGPWDHEGSFDQIERIGGIETGRHGVKRWDTYQAFFDHYLMGLDNGFDKRPPVEIYTLGKGWRFESEWPPKRATPAPFYLSSGGGLSRTPPEAVSADSYDYDPANPVADTVGGTCWGLARELGDRRELETRRDVLVYSTGPLEADIEVTGPIIATLYVSSSAVETDFWVGLVHVRADGYATLLQDGILKSSHRDGVGKAGPLQPDEIYRLDIDLWATSTLFKTGEQIRVEVSSSAFNKYNRNTNTGLPIADAATTIVARQTVHCGGQNSSRIVMPVVSG